MRDCELGYEAAGGDYIAGDDEGGAHAGVVGPPGEDEGDDGGEDVDWDGEELGVGGTVA